MKELAEGGTTITVGAVDDRLASSPRTSGEVGEDLAAASQGEVRSRDFRQKSHQSIRIKGCSRKEGNKDIQKNRP